MRVPVQCNRAKEMVVEGEASEVAASEQKTGTQRWIREAHNYEFKF